MVMIFNPALYVEDDDDDEQHDMTSRDPRPDTAEEAPRGEHWEGSVRGRSSGRERTVKSPHQGFHRENGTYVLDHG